MSDKRNAFTVTLVAKPGAIEPAIRLRQLLKIALRGFSMKCVDVREVPAIDETPTSEDNPHGR